MKRNDLVVIFLCVSAAFALAGCSNHKEGRQGPEKEFFNSTLVQESTSNSTPLVLPVRHLGDPEEFSPSSGGHIGLINRVQSEIFWAFSNINTTENDHQASKAKKLQIYKEIKNESFEIANKRGFLSDFSPLAAQFFSKTFKEILEETKKQEASNAEFALNRSIKSFATQLSETPWEKFIVQDPITNKITFNFKAGDWEPLIPSLKNIEASLNAVVRIWPNAKGFEKAPWVNERIGDIFIGSIYGTKLDERIFTILSHDSIILPKYRLENSQFILVLENLSISEQSKLISRVRKAFEPIHQYQETIKSRQLKQKEETYYRLLVQINKEQTTPAMVGPNFNKLRDLVDQNKSELTPQNYADLQMKINLSQTEWEADRDEGYTDQASFLDIYTKLSGKEAVQFQEIKDLREKRKLSKADFKFLLDIWNQKQKLDIQE